MRSALAGWIVEMLSGHHSRQSSGKDLVAPASSGHVLVPLGRNRRETIRTQKCSWHMLKRGIAAIVLLGPVIDDPALPRWRCNPPAYGCRQIGRASCRERVCQYV